MDNRQRIIEGAAELFRVYGIKAVTMDSIAGHLGMSKRTIYEIFSDKDELLIGVLQAMADKQRQLVEKVLEESGNAILAIFKLLEINRDHFQNMSPSFLADMKKFHNDVLMKRSDKCEMPDYRNNIKVIEHGISQKLFRKEINADIVNRTLYSLGMSMMNSELYPFDQFTRKEVISNVFIAYLRGISTMEGMEQIEALESNF